LFKNSYLRLIGSAIGFLAAFSFYLQYYVPDRPTAVLHAGVVASVATVIMFGSPLASLVCVIILLLFEDDRS